MPLGRCNTFTHSTLTVMLCGGCNYQALSREDTTRAGTENVLSTATRPQIRTQIYRVPKSQVSTPLSRPPERWSRMGDGLQMGFFVGILVLPGCSGLGMALLILLLQLPGGFPRPQPCPSPLSGSQVSQAPAFLKLPWLLPASTAPAMLGHLQPSRDGL